MNSSARARKHAVVKGIMPSAESTQGAVYNEDEIILRVTQSANVPARIALSATRRQRGHAPAAGSRIRRQSVAAVFRYSTGTNHRQLPKDFPATAGVGTMGRSYAAAAGRLGPGAARIEPGLLCIAALRKAPLASFGVELPTWPSR